MPVRYDIREAGPGAWEVFDSTTGLVATVDDVPQTGMDIQDADELVDLLNWFDANKPARFDA